MSPTVDETLQPSVSHCPQLLTVDDLAALLKVSNRTVWRMRSAGQLPNPIRIGGGVRWRQPEIEAWIEQGCPDQQTVQNEKKG